MQWLVGLLLKPLLDYVYGKLAEGIAALFAMFKRKEQERKVGEQIEEAAKKHDEIVAKGEEATREERIKGVEDVLNSGD